MAEVVNKRDLILQHATARTIPVADPGAIIIPGYTGILLTKDITLWVVSAGPNPVNGVPFAPGTAFLDKCVLTAQLKGIPATQPVAWSSNVPLTDTPDPLIKLIEAKNYPIERWATLVSVAVVYGGITFQSSVQMVVFNG